MSNEKLNVAVVGANLDSKDTVINAQSQDLLYPLLRSLLPKKYKHICYRPHFEGGTTIFTI